MAWLRSRAWTTAGIAALLLIAIQAIPYGRLRTDPPVVQEPSWDSPATRELARQACFDCHSNEIERPIYSRVAPVSWLIQRHIDEGRAELNFSEWNRIQEEATEAAAMVRESEMPPLSYRLMHAGARLSDADRDRLARGLFVSLGAVRMEHSER